jgi:signal transduction histidine kinase
MSPPHIRSGVNPIVNRALAALAVVVMLGILALLSWLRQQTLAELRGDVSELVGNFVPEAILHGRGGDTQVRFYLAESLIRQGERSPYIEKAIVTRLTEAGELFLVPFDFGIDNEGNTEQALDGFEMHPLGDPENPFGRIYVEVNWTIVRRINWAIGATAVAITLMLVTLLIRVWSQESTLTRTTVELNDRKRELIRIERLALAGELSAGLLHDLRKPVLNIRHSLEEMRDALGDFAAAAPALTELERNTQLFFDILGESQVERFVRSDRVGEEFVDLSPVLDFSFNLVRYERRAVEVERVETPDLPTVFAHPFRLIQLFSNLILNAYQAMNGQGKLRVETLPASGGVKILLTDSGPGIPEENLERVFDPFFTTKPEGEGTGLGLSICRLIVEEIGGRIHVESRTGGPTTFVVWLPVEGTGR